MQWQKNVVDIRVNGQNQLTQYYTQQGDKIISVLNAGGGISESLHGNEMNHMAVFISNTFGSTGLCYGNGIEPSYAQKLLVLRELGKWKEVAIEIMPAASDVVDVENVYHLWEFQYIYSFCVDVRPIFEPPQRFDLSFEGTKYNFEIKNGVTYIYFKDKDNMPWIKKQRLKNLIGLPISTGVEFICEAMANVDYGCIVVLPHFESLDFGLEQPLY